MPVPAAAATPSTVNAPTPKPSIAACRPLIRPSNGRYGLSLRPRALLLAVQERLVEPVRLLLAAVDDLRVALQRVEVGVAEDLLHQAHVPARHLEKGRGRRVAGHVWRLERPRANLLADQLDDVSSAGGGETPLAIVGRGTIEVDEHRQASVIARREIVLHRLAGVRGQVHASLLGALARDDEAGSRGRGGWGAW